MDDFDDYARVTLHNFNTKFNQNIGIKRNSNLFQSKSRNDFSNSLSFNNSLFNNETKKL